MVKNLHSARKNLGKIAGNFNDPSDQGAALAAKRALDEFIGGHSNMAVPPGAETLTTGGGLAGTIQARKQAADLLKEANANYAAGKRSDLTQGIERAADLRAAAANSGQNTGNTIRQRVASALLKEKDTAGFNEAEKGVLENIVRGSRAANTTRAAGNVLGGGGGLGSLLTGGIGGGLGALFGGPGGAFVGAAAPMAAGGVLKGTSNRITQKALKQADELIRQRSPLFQQRAAQAPTEAERDVMNEAIIRAIIMASPQAN
jgi:hypothetical protein